MREPNIFKRGGVYWLRASVKGIEHRETLRTRDLKTARQARDKRLKEIEGARWRGERLVTWEAAVAAWVDDVAGQIAQTTAKRYGVSLMQCAPFLAGLDVSTIDGKTLAALMTGRRKLGASPATIRRDLTAISRVLEFAEAQDWREGNPTLSKRRLLKERRDPIALPEPAEVEALIAATPARFGALIRAAWLTGCRQAELVNSTWRAFNARARTLEIVGKGNKRRTIALSDEATAQISAQPRTLGCDLIFCRDGGVAFAEAASDFTHFRRNLEAKTKRERRPFRRFRFHDLRHLYAVEELRRGRGIYDLSKHLGHTSIKTTEIYLAFLTPEEADRAKAGSAQKTAQSRRFTTSGAGPSS